MRSYVPACTRDLRALPSGARQCLGRVLAVAVSCPDIPALRAQCRVISTKINTRDIQLDAIISIIVKRASA